MRVDCGRCRTLCLLRFLYYAARGEFARAEPHRIQVELHAAHMGSIWQVETWEAAMLSLVQTTCMNDVIGATRIVHRLDELSRNIPSLRLYLRCAIDALKVVQKDDRDFRELAQRYRDDPPRGYIGWAAMMAAVVRGYNDRERYAEAKSFGEAALGHFGEADVDSIMLYLQLELQVARAEAGTSAVDAGLLRIDRLLTRFARVDHPLLLGLLHEMRALICWDAGRLSEFQESLRETERWFRPTGGPALIAKCEQLAQLSDRGRAQPRPAADKASPARPDDSEGETEVEGITGESGTGNGCP